MIHQLPKQVPVVEGQPAERTGNRQASGARRHEVGLGQGQPYGLTTGEGADRLVQMPGQAEAFRHPARVVRGCPIRPGSR